MARRRSIACTLATTPALSIWSLADGATISLSYDGVSQSHTFGGGGLVLDAQRPGQSWGGESTDGRLELVWDGVVEAALQGDIGSPQARVWWLSDTGDPTASRVDDWLVAIVSSFERADDGRRAILTLSNPVQWLTEPVFPLWTDKAQQARYPGDLGMARMRDLAEVGLAPIGQGPADD